MTYLTNWIDRHVYPAHTKNWDDAMFREWIERAITPDAVILDLGAGAGIVKAMNFKGLVGFVCGVDLDPRVKENPYLDEGRISDAGKIPYPDAKFDLVFSDNVLEHLENPVNVFNEVKRVLKPGGIFLFKTPNKWHYMPVIARLTPHAFHQFVNRLRGRSEIDTFPTLYRANSKKDIIDLADKSGYRIDALEFVEGRPEYLRMTVLTYLAGITYERLVNSTEWLSQFRVVMMGRLVKE